MTSTHASALCTWDAASILSITIAEQACVCIGYAPSNHRGCHNPIAAHNARAANVLIRELPHLSTKPDELETRLVELARLTLCKRNHQDQAQGLAERWLGKILAELRRIEEVKLVLQVPFRGSAALSREQVRRPQQPRVKQQAGPDQHRVTEVLQMRLKYPTTSSRQASNRPHRPTVDEETNHLPGKVHLQQSVVQEVGQKDHIDASGYPRQPNMVNPGVPATPDPEHVRRGYLGHLEASKKAQPENWEQGFSRRKTEYQAVCKLQQGITPDKQLALNRKAGDDAHRNAEQDAATGSMQPPQRCVERDAADQAAIQTQQGQERARHQQEPEIIDQSATQAAGMPPLEEQRARRRAEQSFNNYIATQPAAQISREQEQDRHRAEQKAVDQATAHAAVHTTTTQAKRRPEQELIHHIAAQSTAEAPQEQRQTRRRAEQQAAEQASAQALLQDQGAAEQKDAEEAKNWCTAWARYEHIWTALPSLQPIQGDIPWPVRDGQQASINQENVREFFQHAPMLFRRDEKAMSRMLERQVVRWLPARIGISFPEADEVAMEKMNVVRQVVRGLLKGAMGQW